MTAFAELGLCIDCQLSRRGICDREKMLEQIENAVGLTPQRRQELIDEQMKIAADRGCQGLPDNGGTPSAKADNTPADVK